MQILLSRTQSGAHGRVKQEQEWISRNHEPPLHPSGPDNPFQDKSKKSVRRIRHQSTDPGSHLIRKTPFRRLKSKIQMCSVIVCMDGWKSHPFSNQRLDLALLCGRSNAQELFTKKVDQNISQNISSNLIGTCSGQVEGSVCSQVLCCD